MRLKKLDNVTNCWLGLTLLFLMTSCDPIHDLKLENRTSEKAEVIFYPDFLEDEYLKDFIVSKVKVNGQTMNTLTLEPSKMIRIGTVVARDNPKPRDIELDYLELRFGKDTLRLAGKNAIFSTIQKFDKHDWRLIIRSE